MLTTVSNDDWLRIGTSLTLQEFLGLILRCLVPNNATSLRLDYICTMQSQEWKAKAFAMARASGKPVFFLDSCGNQGSPLHRFHWLAAFGIKNMVRLNPGNLQDLNQLEPGRWWMGYAGYDLVLPPQGLFPPADAGLFFEPEHIIYADDQGLHTVNLNPELWEKFDYAPETFRINPVEVLPGRTRETYLQDADGLLKHIQLGDFYEINYCQRFECKSGDFSVYGFWRELTAHNPMPFSVYFDLPGLEMACAAPERFFYKLGNKLVSQPMKGTAARDLNFAEKDAELARFLHENEKERSENVMIVDLVRNDLSRIALPGSVRVEELFAVYPYAHVHQMISSISCELAANTNWAEIFGALFPMGSMTGAPKRSAMEHIFNAEKRHRRAFSGTAGYISPDGNADFNVLIRSLFRYDGENPEFWVGSALTSACIPEKEWEECMLKIQPVLRLLSGESSGVF